MTLPNRNHIPENLTRIANFSHPHPLQIQNASNETQKSIRELLYNGTGYFMEDEVEPGLNDVQTLFLACFATLVPLVIALLTAFGIRILWTKYRRRRENLMKYDEMVHRDATTETISKPLHEHLLNSDKTGETHLTVSVDALEEVGDDTSNTNQIKSSNHSSTNGSIITMTLKNNHLIVETEERNDIEQDSKETKMTYSPSVTNGVFVVEVQQGNKGGNLEPRNTENSNNTEEQCALVHDAPRSGTPLEDSDHIDTTLLTPSPPHLARTGLSTSATSLTAAPAYSYSLQPGYDTGLRGYSHYRGYLPSPPRTLPDNNKPKIMSAVYKHPHNISLDVPSDGLLNSDFKAGENLSNATEES